MKVGKTEMHQFPPLILVDRDSRDAPCQIKTIGIGHLVLGVPHVTVRTSVEKKTAGPGHLLLLPCPVCSDTYVPERRKRPGRQRRLHKGQIITACQHIKRKRLFHITEGEVGQDGAFGEANPLVFYISHVGEINLKLEFKYIPGMAKERNAEATEIVMRAIEIRESCLQFIVSVDVAQIIVHLAADLEIKTMCRSGQTDALVPVDVIADRVLLIILFSKDRRQTGQADEKCQQANAPSYVSNFRHRFLNDD